MEKCNNLDLYMYSFSEEGGYKALEKCHFVSYFSYSLFTNSGQAIKCFKVCVNFKKNANWNSFSYLKI